MSPFTLIPETVGSPQPQPAPSARAAVELRDWLLGSFPQVGIWRDGIPVTEAELAHLAAMERQGPEQHGTAVTADAPLLPPPAPPLRVVTRR
ncbi:hypothetical protein [Roseomonas indoligenes]|uniref:Uncharacterized protein n=1 Tax=Roseomonas indoligenes TaxID=2820811 RepID=A0A940MXM3_9PROT|nr:hypothetical protein [Pararoseomonas indoligenes]MBP0493986.1 hypothetical protein [Pararoseomonas indoligenes]